MIKDGVFIIGRSCQLLSLLVQEGHTVDRVARHCLVLVVLIEVDPVGVLLSRGSLRLGFLQGHIRLALLDLVEELGPFLLAVRLLVPVNLDPTTCSAASLEVDSIWRVALLAYRWRGRLQDRYGVLLASAMQLLVASGLDTDGILRQIGMPTMMSSSFIRLMLFRYTTGQLVTPLRPLEHPGVTSTGLRGRGRHLVGCGLIEESSHVDTSLVRELLLLRPGSWLIRRVVIVVLGNLSTRYRLGSRVLTMAALHPILLTTSKVRGVHLVHRYDQQVCIRVALILRDLRVGLVLGEASVEERFAIGAIISLFLVAIKI